MERKELEAAIEGILFTLGEAITPEDLAAAVDGDAKTVKKAIQCIIDRYEEDKRGIQIIEVGGAFQMCTRAEIYPYLIKAVNRPKRHSLTDVLLETLSIIAYKQPITKQEIESIRGVKSDHAVNKLVEYHLVEEVGRLDAIGRPILFGTTKDFLRCFGVQSLEELPTITPSKVEGFKQEAQEEAQLTLDL